ncbi:MAG: AAA family ATPase [Anaerolineae bacterium]|nr:AAA family ATPase [Anaerolineae bacterium]
MARLAGRVLGSFEATLDDVPLVGFDSDKVRALLIYLLVESDRAHPRDTLAGLLWPESPQHRARQSLSQAVSNLRTVLGDRSGDHPPCLEVTRQSIRLAPESDVWLDLTALERCLAAVPACEDEREGRAALTELDRLGQAVAYHRGGFLAGFSLPGCPGFEEWALIQRERAERLVLAALRQLADGYAAQGEYEIALRYAWQQLEVVRWQEDAHRQVMRLLAMTGQRNAALAQYETCRRVLADELGAEPEPETEMLVARIRAGKAPVTAVEPPAPPEPRAPKPAAIPSNLPAATMPCVGRRREIAELSEMLVGGQCRLITLLGPGGIGKTRLALAAAEQLMAAGDGGARHFVDGIFGVPLAGVSTGESLFPTIAATLGLQGAGQPERRGADADDLSARERLLAYLRPRSMLLILDNFEHLISSAPQITGMLRAAPALAVLVTSRARLNVVDECLYPVGSLSLPGEAGLGPTDPVGGAAELFSMIARRQRPDFDVRPDVMGDVIEICRLVDGVPLGILMAASWVAALDPPEIRARIRNSTTLARGQEAVPARSRSIGTGQEGIDFLRADWYDMPERHRSMRAVFESSWQLLAREEQMVLKTLSVFRDSFTHERAQTVARATLFDLRSLVDKSLLMLASEGRYRMHELLRQFAREKLEMDAVATVRARAAHTETYVAALEAWAVGLKGPRAKDVLSEMDLEIGNARAAWDHAVVTGDAESVGRAVEGLSLYYDRRARYDEALSTTGAALTMLGELAPRSEADAARRFRARMRVVPWWASFRRREDGLPVLQRALSALRDAPASYGDLRHERARLLHFLASAAQPRYDRGLQSIVEDALAESRAVGDRWLESRVLLQLGWVLWCRGQSAAAMEAYEGSLAVARSLGDLWSVAAAHQYLSGLSMFTGHFQEGLAHAEEQLAICREFGDRAAEARAMHALSIKLGALGRHEEALAASEASHRIWGTLGLQDATVNAVWAWHMVLSGRYDRALEVGRSAADQAREHNDRYALGWALLSLGALGLAEGWLSDAVTLLQESADHYRSMQHLPFLAFPLAMLSLALYRQGRAAEAYAPLREALASSVVTANPPTCALALLVVASLLAAPAPTPGSVVPDQAASQAARCRRAQELVETVAAATAWATASAWFRDVVLIPAAQSCPALHPDRLPAPTSGEANGPSLVAAAQAALTILDEIAQVADG